MASSSVGFFVNRFKSSTTFVIVCSVSTQPTLYSAIHFAIAESGEPAKMTPRPEAKAPKNFEGTTVPVQSARRLTKCKSQADSRFYPAQIRARPSEGDIRVLGRDRRLQLIESIASAGEA